MRTIRKVGFVVMFIGVAVALFSAWLLANPLIALLGGALTVAGAFMTSAPEEPKRR